MRWSIVLLGVITILLGLIPIAYNYEYLPLFLEFIPREGIIYNLLVTAIGVILTYFGIKRL